MLVYGSTMYGKVDEVPGLFYVKTRFGHLWFVPLIPLGSFSVFEETGDGMRGAAIPLSGKSILVAWMRAACFLGALGLGIVALATLDENLQEATAAGVFALVLVALLIFTYRMNFFKRASYERAVQLANAVGLSPMGRLMIEVAYGRMTPEQANAALAKIEQQEAAPQAPAPWSAQELNAKLAPQPPNS